MQTSHAATIYWTGTLASGIYFLVFNIIGVSLARGSALKVNGIELSAWWYVVAFLPVLSVLASIAYPRSHPVWQRSRLFTSLGIVVLASLVHIPLLYVLGGFR